MFKVYPHQSDTNSSTVSNMSSTRAIYTIWMKSLVFHGCGCTVFDSNGEIIYRIDNYAKKSRSQVYLMNLRGKVLFSLQRKKLQIFNNWNGFKWNGGENKMKGMKPWFQVREECIILRRRMQRRRILYVTLGCNKKAEGNYCYKIVGFAEKSEFKIIGDQNQVVAEVKRKKSCSGVVLGDDVLSLVVEPQMDHLLIMGLVTVYGLINNKL